MYVLVLKGNLNLFWSTGLHVSTCNYSKASTKMSVSKNCGVIQQKDLKKSGEIRKYPQCIITVVIFLSKYLQCCR